MKQTSIGFISILTFCSACNVNSTSESIKKEFVQVQIVLDNNIPTIDIDKCILITNNPKTDSVEAIELLRIKRLIPLAMQTKDSAIFESILAKNFTLRGEGEFFNRNDYIHNRINGTWTIDTVKYQNLALQFYDNMALLTYRNILDGTDDDGKPAFFFYSWADIFIKEDNKWKFLAIQNIDARTEYIKK